ncbi:N-acetylneuraminate synthase [Devosia sp. XGJD_8]|uniref:N-acetylneuraminate synthase n=1 Tax=Devosia sp. XGJD_8 TaxID=3391187 RepID=UPI003984E4FE
MRGYAVATNSVFIIAEAGVNHNGDTEMALRLVDVAADAGADAVKFQTFSAEKLTRRGAQKAEYQKQATGDGDQLDMLKALEMSVDMHEAVFERCRERGIEFMSTAFDEDSFDYLVKLGIKRVKVPSGEITNLPFLQHMARAGLPLILSTGMATLDEVRDAADVVRSQPTAGGLTVLHCTSNYPAAPEDVNLLAMHTIGRELHVPVGYSDHTLGITVSVAAVALGAEVIEKHFTLDKSLPGPDHQASLDPQELLAMVAAIRVVEAAKGDGVKAPRASELPVRNLVRRSITAAANIASGAEIRSADLVLLRPGNGIPPAGLDTVIGRKAARDIAAGQTLAWSDLA